METEYQTVAMLFTELVAMSRDFNPATKLYEEKEQQKA